MLVSSEDVTALSEIDGDLWKYRDDSFLPHGRSGEHNAHQPILLTEALENENKSSVLVLLNGRDTQTSDVSFERVMVVFDDQDSAARKMARQQYTRATSNDQTVRYFQQTDTGGWSEKKT